MSCEDALSRTPETVEQRPARTRVVRMLALNINPRDLSIGLVMLKEFALRSEAVRDGYEIHLHQWTKDHHRFGEPGTVDGVDLDAVVDSLDPENTDVFGFSMYTWNHHFMLAVAERLKARNPNAVTLFGGSQAGGYGARLLEENPFVDYVISGEAEYSFRTFLTSLPTGDLAWVPNLYFREGDTVQTTVPTERRAAKKASYLDDIEDLPLPFESQEYRDYLDALDEPVTAQFETERGCPLACAFCSWGTTLPLRRRSREDVERGLTYLLEHKNVKAVYVVDANPFINQKKGRWLSEFVRYKNKTGKPVFFEVNPEYIRDPMVIENLGSLQGDEMAFGLQSTSDVTLKKIKRKFHRDTYERNVQRLREMNPNANIKFSLILGLPADTLSAFENSLDFVIGMRPNDIYVHDLLVLPGSEMYRDPKAFGIEIDPNPPHRLLTNETFPRGDYNRAKHLGFYTKVLTNIRPVRDGLLALAQDLEVRPVDLYLDFIAMLMRNGVDALEGAAVSEVSSERFDHFTREFTGTARQTDAVVQLFHRFRRRRRWQHRAAAGLDRMKHHLRPHWSPTPAK